MRKSNFMTLLVFCVMTISVVVITSCSKTNAGHNNSVEETIRFETPVLSSQPSEQYDDPSSGSMDAIEETGKAEDPSDNTTPIVEQGEDDVEPADLSDALFIGDSRTVGIMEYAGLSEANFFCTTGMSVFNIHKDRISVPTIGKVTLTELLSNKKYGKIYVMLGINELGYPFQSVIDKYGELYDFIREYQQDAAIFIQANLHVTEKRSESDKYINNTAINKLNTELEKLTDNQNTYYLDVNPLFDDDGGNLSADKSSDNAHLYAKHYVEWGDWLRIETAKLL